MTDKVKKDIYPLEDGTFSGGAGVYPRLPDALSDALNVLAADAGQIQNASAGSIAVAGGATPSIELEGEDWSDTAADYIIKIGKYDGEVASVSQTGGVTTLTLSATPALTDYAATEPIIVTVVGKLKNKEGYVAAGSLQLAGA